jgi:flagellar hook assembly protein FlgD
VALEQNYPNPFNPTTTIAFTLSQPGVVDLSIFDVAGQRVRTLERGVQPAGRNSVVWDGRGDDGTAVASGVYFYRLTVGARVFTRKMLLVK